MQAALCWLGATDGRISAAADAGREGIPWSWAKMTASPLLLFLSLSLSLAYTHKLAHQSTRAGHVPNGYSTGKQGQADFLKEGNKSICVLLKKLDKLERLLFPFVRLNACQDPAQRVAGKRRLLLVFRPRTRPCSNGASYLNRIKWKMRHIETRGWGDFALLCKRLIVLGF